MRFENWLLVGPRGEHLRRLLAEAAEPALEQIRRDHDRPQLIYPMHDAFDYLAEHLFSAELRVQRLFERTRVKGSKAYQSFQAITGVRPATYIAKRRLETAVGLLVLDEGITIEETALCVGYTVTDTFRRAFERWAHVNPGLFHRHVWRFKRQGPPGLDPRVFTSEFGARFLAKTLTASKCQPALDWLAVAAPLPGSAVPRSPRAWLERAERRWLEFWWPMVQTFPAAQLHEELGTVPCETPAIFGFLCERSREEGRDDRQRGVMVAELARAALERLASCLPAWEVSFWQAKVWGCLGNARCAALDFAGAETALDTAEGFLSEAGITPELHAEVAFVRSCLRCAQRRFTEAIEQADAALRWLGDQPGRLQAQILLARAQAFAYQGEAERAIPDFRAAVAALEGVTEPYVSWTAHQNLAGALWLVGRLEEAAAWLQRARAQAARLGRLAAWCHTLWLEGLLADQQGRTDDAVARLREACAGLQGLGVPAEAAVAALDLAKVETARGEHELALRRVVEAIPHLEKLQLEREGVAALALLRQGVQARQLSAAVLGAARRHAARAAGVAEPPERRER